MIIIPNKDVERRFLSVLRERIWQLKEIEWNRAEKLRQKEEGRKQKELEVKWQSLHTRELLAMLENYRNAAGGVEWYALKNLLANRPHIPNKMEGKRNRRKQATMHHGPRKRKHKTK